MVNVNGQDQMLYELYAIFIHSGGAMGGHYYAYIQDFGTKQWFEFNDSTISGPLNEAQIQQAYGGCVREGSTQLLTLQPNCPLSSYFLTLVIVVALFRLLFTGDGWRCALSAIFCCTLQSC
eukprot:SAG31_NODE_366_length_16817_cov_17.317921_5_plen_121_part_00